MATEAGSSNEKSLDVEPLIKSRSTSSMEPFGSIEQTHDDTVKCQTSSNP